MAAQYYSITETSINWLSTAFLFAFVVIFPLTIRILHWGPKPSFVVAAVLILVGNWIRFAGSFSRAGGIFAPVMVGQILTGLAQPFVLAAPTRYSDLWFTGQGRVTATAVASLANPLGAALGQLVNPFWVNEPGDVSSMVLYVAIIVRPRAPSQPVRASRTRTSTEPYPHTVIGQLRPSLLHPRQAAHSRRPFLRDPQDELDGLDPRRLRVRGAVDPPRHLLRLRRLLQLHLIAAQPGNDAVWLQR